MDTMTGWTLDENVRPDHKVTPQELGTDGPMYQDPFDYHRRLHNDVGDS